MITSEENMNIRYLYQAWKEIIYNKHYLKKSHAQRTLFRYFQLHALPAILPEIAVKSSLNN